MTLAEILKAKGVDDAVIKGIMEDMKSNKIFTASEENLDVRYGKLKTDHDSVIKERDEGKALIAELQKSNKGNETLQQKVADYEAKMAQIQAELEQTKLDAAIKVELLSSKALDVDYLTFKLKEKGELALDENGKIDAKKLDPIIYDSVTHAYWNFGEKVGQAFSDGKKIK